jgi:hypothetical protein
VQNAVTDFIFFIRNILCAPPDLTAYIREAPKKAEAIYL